MRVNRQLRMLSETAHTRKPDAVHAYHHTRSARGKNLIMTAAHLIHFAADVEGVHNFLSRSVRVPVAYVHDGFDAIRERTVRPVAP